MNIDKATQDQITNLFTSYTKTNSPGFAVGISYEQNIVFSQGFGQATLEHFSPINSETVFDVGSITKQFVGMAIALLEEDGHLSLNDNIRKYIPEFPGYAQGITLANLLVHTSGIRSYTVLAYYMKGYHESDAITKEEIFDLLIRLRSINFRPGERWEYSDSNYFLLAEIIERITGKSLNEYVKEAIFLPLDMQNTLFRQCHSQVIRNRAVSYVNHQIVFRSPFSYRRQQESPDSFHTLISNYEHVGAEGLFTTVGDLLKWDRNFTDNHLGNGKKGLINRVLSPRVQINAEIGYGYGINIGIFKGKKFFGHDGAIHGYTSSMIHFPEERVTIVCLSNHNLESSWTYRDRIMDIIFPGGKQMVSPKKQTRSKVNGLDKQKITGMYQDPETASIWEVFFEKDCFYIRVNNHIEYDLLYVKPFVYRTVQPDMEFKFEIDSTGQIEALKAIVAERTFTLIPFLQNPLGTDELLEYCGNYRSAELETTFNVTIDKQRLIVRNTARHFCSMDLSYAPTIRDNFIAYDPHPASSQITFLRERDQIEAFVYRDYDGDGREALRFEKIYKQASPSCS